MKKKFVVRLIVYSVVLLYLFLDLSCGGPLSKSVRRKANLSVEEFTSINALATVYGQPITEGQVIWKIDERLWRQGRFRSELSETEYQQLYHFCLEGLIKSHLIGIKSYHNRELVEASESDIKQQLKRIKSSFISEQAFENSLKNHGLSENFIKDYQTRILEKEAYLSNQIKTSAEVSANLLDKGALTHSLKLKHYFLARSEVKTENALLTLNSKLPLTDSVLDEFTDLGWINPKRFPSYFSQQLKELSLSEPTVVESPYGYHLLLKLGEHFSKKTHRDSKVNHQEYLQRKKGFDYYVRHLRYRDSDRVSYLKKG